MKKRPIDLFINAYLECALWASMDEMCEPFDGLYTADDIAEEARKAMLGDCARFWQAHQVDIRENPVRAGHDFWLTRNGHGAGFWEGPWPEKVGRVLTEASKVYGSCDLYVGDDGMVYCS